MGKLPKEEKKMNIKKVIAFLFVQLMDAAFFGMLTHPEVCPRVVDGAEVVANAWIRYGLYTSIVLIWLWSAIVLIGKKKKKRQEFEDESNEKKEEAM